MQCMYLLWGRVAVPDVTVDLLSWTQMFCGNSDDSVNQDTHIMMLSTANYQTDASMLN